MIELSDLLKEPKLRKKIMFVECLGEETTIHEVSHSRFKEFVVFDKNEVKEGDELYLAQACGFVLTGKDISREDAIKLSKNLSSKQLNEIIEKAFEFDNEEIEKNLNGNQNTNA